MHLQTNSKQYNRLLDIFFAGATEYEAALVGCNFGSIPLVNVPKYYRGKYYVSWHRTWKLVRLILYGTQSQPFNYRFYGSHKHAHTWETQSHRNLYRSQSASKNAKSWNSPRNGRIGPVFSTTDLVRIFGSNVGNEIRILFKGKRLHKPVFVYDIVRIHSVKTYTDFFQYEVVGNAEALMLRCFPFFPC